MWHDTAGFAKYFPFFFWGGVLKQIITRRSKWWFSQPFSCGSFLPRWRVTSPSWKHQASAALHSKPGCSQQHLTEEQMRATWSHGKIPSVHAKDCYVLAEDQWMNQGLSLIIWKSNVFSGFSFRYFRCFFFLSLFWRHLPVAFLGWTRKKVYFTLLKADSTRPFFQEP